MLRVTSESYAYSFCSRLPRLAPKLGRSARSPEGESGAAALNASYFFMVCMMVPSIAIASIAGEARYSRLPARKADWAAASRAMGTR
jgi:hypothetical protein